MTEQLDNPLRIKVTGRCNRNCFFCHQEGGMADIGEIGYSENLKRIIDVLYSAFHMRSVALTGGEPLLYDGLLELVKSISENTKVCNFLLTTNGSIRKPEKFWLEFKNLGLSKVNISIPDVLDYVTLTGENDHNCRVFQNQISLVKMLNSLEIKTNINVVVYNDKKHLLNVLNALFASDIAKYKPEIALLPDLSSNQSFERSQEVIKEILGLLGCRRTRYSRRKGTSDAVSDYLTHDGHRLQVKTTKPNGTPKWLETICGRCDKKTECQEGFYGLRLESRNDELYLRLCICKSTDDVLMTVDDFLQSEVYGELKTMWK